MQNNYNRENIFYKILNNEIPCDKVYEDDKILAFYDISPKASVHILVIPKKECISFNDFIKNSKDEEISYFFKKVQEIAENQNLTDYKIVANIGKKAEQAVFHYHLHILGYK